MVFSPTLVLFRINKNNCKITIYAGFMLVLLSLYARRPSFEFCGYCGTEIRKNNEIGVIFLANFDASKFEK